MKRFYNIASAVVFCVVFLSWANTSQAATLSSASNLISTSRPSPSSPFSANEAAGQTTLSIFNNGSRFLASDSAKIIKTTTATDIDSGLNVSSQSAGLTEVFLTSGTNVLGGGGVDVLYTPITAMHKIRFTAITEIPATGDIVLIFPTLASGDADNDASPSATTFQFNNVIEGADGADNVEVWDDNGEITDLTVVETEPSAGNPGSISIQIDTNTIAAGSVVTIFLGCDTTSNENTCTAQDPRLINPTKRAAAGTGDSWKMTINTENGSDNLLDTATISIATIDSVSVYATVDPTLTFTIGGINNGTTISGTYGACTGSDATNTGINASATVVNMGILSGIINIAAQELEVTTNAASGYTINATSSGALRDFATGHSFLTDTSLPGSAMTAGNEFFGIHACGTDVDTGDWGSGDTGGGVNALYAWPHNGTTSSTLQIASRNGVSSAIETVVKYAGTISGTTPAGFYQSYITYVATPVF